MSAMHNIGVILSILALSLVVTLVIGAFGIKDKVTDGWWDREGVPIFLISSLALGCVALWLKLLG